MGEHFQSGLVRLGSHVIGEFGSLETRKYFTTETYVWRSWLSRRKCICGIGLNIKSNSLDYNTVQWYVNPRACLSCIMT